MFQLRCTCLAGNKRRQWHTSARHPPDVSAVIAEKASAHLANGPARRWRTPKRKRMNHSSASTPQPWTVQATRRRQDSSPNILCQTRKEHPDPQAPAFWLPPGRPKPSRCCPGAQRPEPEFGSRRGNRQTAITTTARSFLPYQKAPVSERRSPALGRDQSAAAPPPVPLPAQILQLLPASSHTGGGCCRNPVPLRPMHLSAAASGGRGFATLLSCQAHRSQQRGQRSLRRTPATEASLA